MFGITKLKFYQLIIIVIVIFQTVKADDDDQVSFDEFKSIFDYDYDAFDDYDEDQPVGSKFYCNSIHSYTLPTRFAVPISYQINLIPMISELKFYGKVLIKFRMLEHCNKIRLHVNNLDIIEVKFGNVNASYFEIIPKYQLLIVYSKNLLFKESVYNLSIKYEGTINYREKGMYVIKNPIDSSDDYDALLTSFKPTAVREVVPTFDHPYFRSKVTLAVPHAADKTFISILPFSNSLNWDDIKPVGSIDIGFVIYKTKLFKTVNDILLVRSLNNTEKSRKIIEKLSKYFQIRNAEFKNLKYQIIALPLENYDIIIRNNLTIISESLVNFNDIHHLPRAELELTSNIGHALSHVWWFNSKSFTVANWYDLWLFYTVVNFVLKYDLSSLSIIDKNTLMLDGEMFDSRIENSYINAPYIKESTYDPKKINFRYSTPQVSKALAIIHMFVKVIGGGISQLIKDSNDKLSISGFYKNLMENAKALSLKIPKSVLESWFFAKGMPVVNIRQESLGHFEITQDRFCYMKNVTNRFLCENIKWYIPLTYTKFTDYRFTNSVQTIELSAETNKFLLPDNPKKYHDDKLRSHHLFIFNVDANGFYRVNYETKYWKHLINHLIFRKNEYQLNSRIRAQLIDDSFNLARAELLDYEIPLELAHFLSEETDIVPWQAAIKALNYLNAAFIGQKHHCKFEKFYYNLLRKVTTYVGFNLDVNLGISGELEQELILRAACQLQISGCHLQAAEQLNILLANNNTEEIQMPLLEIKLCAIIKFGSPEEQKRVYSLLKKDFVDEKYKSIVRRALCCTTHPVHFEQNFYNYQMETTNSMEYRKFLETFAEGPTGLNYALEFLYQRKEILQIKYGYTIWEIEHFMKIMVKNAFWIFPNWLEYKDKEKDEDHIFNKLLEIISVNHYWIKHQKDKVEEWLDQYISHEEQCNTTSTSIIKKKP